MNKRHILIATALVGSIGLTAFGQATPDQPAQTGSSAGSSATGSSAQSAGDRTSSGSSSTASQSDARQVLSQTVNAAISKNGLDKLSQQFSRADQTRLSELSKQ